MTSKLNVMTGAMEWELVEEYYDYRQELARAGFADMLHDYERVSHLKKDNKIDFNSSKECHNL